MLDGGTRPRVPPSAVLPAVLPGVRQPSQTFPDGVPAGIWRLLPPGVTMGG